MIKPIIAFIIASLAVTSVSAQTTAPSTDVYAIARTATGNGEYHYVEAFGQKGKLIPWDISYIDFGHASDYREVIIGAGGTLFDSKHLVVIGEGYIDKALGPTSGGATYLIPWALAIYHITPKVGGQVTYFPYLPLNEAGRIQHVLERAKLEYDFGRIKMGGGYAGYQFGQDEWQSRPFITTTLKAGPVGNVELWLQRLPSNHLTFQVRWDRTFHTKPVAP